MKQDVIAPSPGESISQGILAVWLKPDGATVEVGEEIFEFESDKATLEIPSPEAGIVGALSVQVGDRVSQGTLLLVLGPASAGVAERLRFILFFRRHFDLSSSMAPPK